MSGISAIYILDHKGRVLITRSYRADIPYNIHEKFNQKMIENDEITLKPVFVDADGTSYFYTRVNNLMFLAVSKRNSNAAMVFSFMFRFIQVLTNYFKELEEESIRDNFVVIYELLDEMMDNGYPQTTEEKILREFIKTEKYELTKKEKKHAATMLEETKIPSAISDIVNWRPPNLVYKKNEVFLDVIEKVNMLISSTANVIKSEVIGALKMKCFLSGMPELKLGLNDKVLFELQGRATKKKAVDLNDIKFHQCVKLTKFENERIISFIPPDGEFELISYRLDVSVKPLFMVEVTVDHRSKTKLEFFVKVKSNYKAKCIANNVEIYIPVPSDAQSPSFQTPNGTVSYIPDKDAMMWNVKQFAGHKDMSMSASFSLPTVVSPERDKYLKTPIQVEFEIPYFTVSGIQVRYLKIQDKSGYQAYPWVRYISRNGEYMIRMK